MNRPNNRDDCWSDGATQTLIEAWGDRYVQLNRGNLRQTDWKEIAISVNARQSGVKPHKTDVQCKNRIDTLKKKYKVEKSKPAPSNWAFYHRLHSLIGATDAVNKKKPATTVTLTVKSSKTKPNDTSPIRWSAPAIDSDGSMECSHEMEFAVKRKQRFETVNFSEGAAFRELARAILKFGEIYERIESSKQEQMMELEKQRMEFTKELEFQRMNMFMDTQLEVQKRMKRPKYGTTSGKM